MEPAPKIDILPYKHRSIFFWFLCVVFLIALPSLIFYTTGYRLSFENEETSIVTTGGMYVTAENLEVDVYLDEEQVERPRLFRSAYYIQNIDVGLHRIVVQRSDLQTWVKDLPVDPYIVTEAAAFNMPAIPHLRPITEYVTSTGTAVYRFATTTEELFTFATSTEEFVVSTSSATTTLVANPEFDFASSLFSTTSTSTLSVFDRFMDTVDRFRFATSSDNASTSSSTPIERILRGDMALIDDEDDLYARWLGSVNSIPYYFCLNETSATTTANRYGQHVADAVLIASTSTSSPLIYDSNRICRTEIKLDRLRQDVFYYDFFPNSSDLVILHLQDGIYVTEIDDRAWQNTQLLYPGTDVRVIVENDVIYLKDNDTYFEIITEIELN